MIEGKGLYIWKLGRVDNGDPQRIAEQAAQAGLGHLLIKLANWAGPYNTGFDIKGLVNALHARNIQAWGWGYVVGKDPVGEAAIAIRQVLDLDLDGWVANAEVEYKAPGMDKPARKFTAAFKKVAPVPLALSSYRYPSVHPEFPWQAWLEGVDIIMPQVYHIKATDAGHQLLRTFAEFKALQRRFGLAERVFFPTGAAFKEHGWQPTAGQLQDFMLVAHELKLTGFNFWEWYHARVLLPDLWRVISDHQWRPVIDPQPFPKPIVTLKRLYVRSNPAVESDNVLGFLVSGAEPIAFEERQVKGDCWVRIGKNLWISRVYQGDEMSRYV